MLNSGLDSADVFNERFADPGEIGLAVELGVLLDRHHPEAQRLQAIGGDLDGRQAGVDVAQLDARAVVAHGGRVDEVSLKHAIAAVRNITIEGLRKVEASEQQLSASKSTFESVSASSKDPLPTTIYFRCEPYHGFENRLFVLRLGIRTSDGKPAITLRIVNEELHEEQMAQELSDKVRAAVNDACPVLIGDYTGRP